MKVFYHVDNDGKCAGFWVKELAKHYDNYPLEFYKINYGMEFPFDEIQENEQVYIVDYSIFPEEMDRLLEITNDVVWIDHHQSAIERYRGYTKNIRGIRLDGVAGCMLTFCFLYFMTDGGVGEVIKNFDISMTQKAPMFTKLIADYDVWTFEYGTRTREFASGFDLYDNEPNDEVWNDLANDIDETLLDAICKSGADIIAYRSRWAAEYCTTKGFVATLDGFRAFAINLAMVSSDDFNSVDSENYDMFVGFSSDGKVWTYSLRSNKIDVAKIAMNHGGGGHVGAAGFSSDELLLIPQNQDRITEDK